MKKKVLRLAEAMVVAVMSASVAFLLIYLYQDCRPIGTANVTSPLQVFTASKIETEWSRIPTTFAGWAICFALKCCRRGGLVYSVLLGPENKPGLLPSSKHCNADVMVENASRIQEYWRESLD